MIGYQRNSEEEEEIKRERNSLVLVAFDVLSRTLYNPLANLYSPFAAPFTLLVIAQIALYKSSLKAFHKQCALPRPRKWVIEKCIVKYTTQTSAL